MIKSPARFRALAFFSVTGLGLAFCGPHGILLSHAAAQTVDGAPVLAPAAQPTSGAPTGEMAHTDAKGRHLAPHDTFYIVSYVSAKTDKGVEGFIPGQEVRLVSVDHDKRTLVVSDGHAEVEVSPNQLTNDMEIAAMVRQKDQAGQAKINSYLQAEAAAYQKYEHDQAVAAAQELKEIKQEQVTEARTAAVAQAAPAAQMTAATEVQDGSVANVGSGYYNEGGYGYGSPYSYFYGNGARNGNRAARETARAARETTGGRGTQQSAAGAGGNNNATSAAPATANVGTAGSAAAGAPAARTGGAAAGTAGSAASGAPAAGGGATTGAAGGGRH